MGVPNIIHQLWIGPKPAPKRIMASWVEKHPGFQYLFWNEADLAKLYGERKIYATSSTGVVFEQVLECMDKIISMEEICGKADIIRWEICCQYGGVFLDADCICIEAFDKILMDKDAFVGFEHETARPGLLAVGTMGFLKGHPLCRAAIDHILANDVSRAATGKAAWQTTGPVLLTNLYKTNLYNDVFVFPSWTFLPIHHTGAEYRGHGKVYAYQAWGSTHHGDLHTIQLPLQFHQPDVWVSVLICSFNTKHEYVLECLNSIKAQEGHFGMELVWINDGSNDEATRLLETALNDFLHSTRFCNIVYHNMERNQGVSACLRAGIQLCSHELVMRHDSDDIMLPHRFQTQLAFMKDHTDCVLLGSNIQFLNMVDGGSPSISGRTHHPTTLTWDAYKTTKTHWFMNHPTLMFKRSAVLAVGNYSDGPCTFEDLQLELKLLKQYGVIYNIDEPLVTYRLHPDQVTYAGKTCTPAHVAARCAFIESLL
jgi:hypothetical protein